MCTSYITEYSDNALKAYSTCAFELCEGDQALISSCNDLAAKCTAEDKYNYDTFARLFNSTDAEVALNDDATEACKCSSMTFVAPLGSGCQTYTIHEGCHEDVKCSGQFKVQRILQKELK